MGVPINRSVTNESDLEGTSYDDNHFPVVKIAFTSAWSILVLVPNCLVLVVLILKPNLRKNHRTEFILWLCVSDLMIGLTSVLYLLTNVLRVLATSPVFCGFTLHCVYSGVLLSLSHTFLLCYERYLAVVKKIKFELFRKRVKYRLVAGSWVTVSLYVGIMAILFLRVDTIDYCGIEAFPQGKYYMISASIVCLPLLILTICIYIIFVINLRKTLRKIYATTIQTVNDANSLRPGDLVSVAPSRFIEQRFQQREREITVTIGLIATALFVLTGPFVVTKFLEGISLVSFSRAFKTIISFLAGSNSLLNPLFYAWRLPAFRKEVRSIFTNTT